MPEKLHIWLIDDDVVYQSLVEFLFEVEDDDQKSIKIFNNGAEALGPLKLAIESGVNLPAAILLDINMPVMGGWEFLDSLSSLYSNVIFPFKIFVISSSISAIDREKALSYEMVEAYITKPISNQELNTINKSFADI